MSNSNKGLILWVDTRISRLHPSTRSLVDSLPELKLRGWKVHALAFDVDDDIPLDEFHPLPKLKLPRPLDVFGTILLINFWLKRNRKRLKELCPEGPLIVHSNASLTTQADIVVFHYDNAECNRIQRQLMGFEDWKEKALYILRAAVSRIEKKVLASPKPRRILAVSRALATSLSRITPPQYRDRIEVFPNCYDTQRFNPAERGKHYESIRQELGFSADQIVLGLGSLGHFRRKGFWLATQTLEILHREHNLLQAQLLLIGGQPRTLDKLRSQLDLRHPGWQKWLTFTGFVPKMEKYLSACDTLFAPSYYEAFSLVEIEAGALGVPLIVTPHPGTEMILREGVNGILVDFDPAKIAERLANYPLENLRNLRGDPGEALTQDEYAQKLTILYEEVCQQLR